LNQQSGLSQAGGEHPEGIGCEDQLRDEWHDGMHPVKVWGLWYDDML